MFRYAKKNCFVQIFPHFSKKNFHRNDNFNKELFLLKYSIYLEKIHRNRVTISKRKRFLLKFLFPWKIFLEKWGKIWTKQFFPICLNKLGKINYAKWWRVPCYFKKIFFNWVLKRAFYEIMNKNLEGFKMFQLFFYIKFFMFHEPRHLCP